MPSTVVHVAVAGLLATSLLAEHFDGRAALVVMAAAAVPDLDTLVGWWVPGGHRAVLHTLLFPAALGVLLFVDSVGESRLRARWGEYGTRVAWVSLCSLLVAGIGLDFFSNGVNPLYPVHDQFYSVSGEIAISSEEGLVQSLLEAKGSTETTHYSTGFDLAPGADPAGVERTFPIVRSGRGLLLGVTSIVVVGFRAWEARKK